MPASITASACIGARIRRRRERRQPGIMSSTPIETTRLEHAIELPRLFPDARLLVLPGGHGDYVAEASSAPTDTDYAEITARLVERFLDMNDASAFAQATIDS